MIRRIAFLAGALVLSTSAFAGYSYNSFGAGAWGTSDATLGVSGYTIEDFEDVNLAGGLMVGVVSPNGNLAPTSVLPNTFKPADDAFGNAFTLGGGGAWDGLHGVINTRTNQTFSYSESGSWGNLTFYFNSARSVGFSLQQMDRDANLIINGVSQGSINLLATNFSGGNGRQGYFRIDATGSDVINSVGLVDAFGGGDGYMFDHVAFTTVPEPGSLAVLGLGALAILRKRRK